MKKLIIIMLLCFLSTVSCTSIFAEDKKVGPKVNISSSSKYSVEVTIRGIPKGEQTLFVPIKIDTMILDFDKVALEGLSSNNILAVASNSKDKVGPGVGLLKLDEKGLPETLTLKVLLKPVSDGQTSIGLIKVADEPALPSKGAVINEDVKISVVNLETPNEVEVTEKLDGGKKRLVLNENKLTFDIKRSSQKEESFFIPIIFDRSIVDLDETFGHAIVAPGIAAKSFSSGSLHEGGPGVEIVVSDVADKDFTVDVDLTPKKAGKAKIVAAYPLRTHIAIVSGPQVDINPTSISVVSHTVVLDK